MGKSQAEQIALLSPEQQAQILAGFDMKALQYNADFWLRPEQKIWEGDQDWTITAVTSGRGWGKTRAASEFVRHKALTEPGCRIAVAGRTAGDVRRVMVTGDSGILSVHGPDERPKYKAHISRIEWPNGSLVELFSSEAPSSARGPQFHYCVGDEFAAWKTDKDDSGATLYDNLLLATRLGDNPQILLTTTPKRTEIMKDIITKASDPKERTRLITGSTMDNSALSSTYKNNMLLKYKDSDLARQELYGELLEGVTGIIFTDDMIDNAIEGLRMPKYPLKVIAVDPSVSADPKKADECGIMAMGATTERNLNKRRAILLEDYSLRAAPDNWVKEVVRAAREHNTKNIVVEKNQGGDLLRSVIQTQDPSLKVFPVTATKGKLKRAEPIVVAMQQKRIKFTDDFLDLRDQLVFYDPENKNGKSPDRLDAFVWGATSLLIAPPEGLRVASSRVTSPVGSQLPTNGVGVGRSRHTSSVKIQR